MSKAEDAKYEAFFREQFPKVARAAALVMGDVLQVHLHTLTERSDVRNVNTALLDAGCRPDQLSNFVA